MFLPAHGNKRQNDVPQNESYSYQRAFAADKQHSRDQGHQYPGNEEAVRQDLNIHTDRMREKTFGPEHRDRDKRRDRKASDILKQ